MPRGVASRENQHRADLIEDPIVPRSNDPRRPKRDLRPPSSKRDAEVADIYTVGCKLFARFRGGGVNYLDSLRRRVTSLRRCSSRYDAPLSVFGWLPLASHGTGAESGPRMTLIAAWQGQTGVPPRRRSGPSWAPGTRIGCGLMFYTKSRMLCPMAPWTALNSNVFFFIVTELWGSELRNGVIWIRPSVV